MTQPAKAQEPSIDEILASIRRIIAHDEPATAAPGEAAKTAPSSENARASAVAPPAPPAEAATWPAPHPTRVSGSAASSLSARVGRDNLAGPFGKRDAAPAQDHHATARAAPSSSGSAERASLRGETGRAAPARPPLLTPSEQPQLLSPASAAAVDAAFDSLAQAAPGPRTLEDIVRDMLRPMLRSWLDDNLPPMVERLVRAEIERLTRAR